MTTPRKAPAPGSRLRRDDARVLRTLDPETRTVRFVFSDGSIDRMGDDINPNGWDTAAFMKNPVILWAHNSGEPPIGRALKVWSDGTRLLGDIKFASAETYPFADTIFKLVSEGFLHAGSVGFLPTKFRWADDDDRPFGISFEKQELLEFSICPVPANANALIQAQAKGLLSMRDMRRIRGQGVVDDDGLILQLRARAKLRRLRLARQPAAADDAGRSHGEESASLDQSERARLVDARRAADAMAFSLQW